MTRSLFYPHQEILADQFTRLRNSMEKVFFEQFIGNGLPQLPAFIARSFEPILLGGTVTISSGIGFQRVEQTDGSTDVRLIYLDTAENLSFTAAAPGQTRFDIIEARSILEPDIIAARTFKVGAGTEDRSTVVSNKWDAEIRVRQDVAETELAAIGWAAIAIVKVTASGVDSVNDTRQYYNIFDPDFFSVYGRKNITLHMRYTGVRLIELPFEFSPLVPKIDQISVRHYKPSTVQTGVFVPGATEAREEQAETLKTYAITVSLTAPTAGSETLSNTGLVWGSRANDSYGGALWTGGFFNLTPHLAYYDVYYTGTQADPNPPEVVKGDLIDRTMSSSLAHSPIGNVNRYFIDYIGEGATLAEDSGVRIIMLFSTTPANRDYLVSLYFSFYYTHGTGTNHAAARDYIFNALTSQTNLYLTVYRNGFFSQNSAVYKLDTATQLAKADGYSSSYINLQGVGTDGNVQVYGDELFELMWKGIEPEYKTSSLDQGFDRLLISSNSPVTRTAGIVYYSAFIDTPTQIPNWGSFKISNFKYNPDNYDLEFTITDSSIPLTGGVPDYEVDADSIRNNLKKVIIKKGTETRLVLSRDDITIDRGTSTGSGINSLDFSANLRPDTIIVKDTDADITDFSLEFEILEIETVTTIINTPGGYATEPSLVATKLNVDRDYSLLDEGNRTYLRLAGDYNIVTGNELLVSHILSPNLVHASQTSGQAQGDVELQIDQIEQQISALQSAVTQIEARAPEVTATVGYWGYSAVQSTHSHTPTQVVQFVRTAFGVVASRTSVNINDLADGGLFSIVTPSNAGWYYPWVAVESDKINNLIYSSDAIYSENDLWVSAYASVHINGVGYSVLARTRPLAQSQTFRLVLKSI